MVTNKKLLVVSIISIIFPIVVSGVFLTTLLVGTDEKSKSKSPYEIYCEAHPTYSKTEDEWLDDLVNGRLADKKTYTVSFNSVGGSAVESQLVDEGSKVKKPDNPTKLGYTFAGWNYRNEEWKFNGYVVTEDIQLVAEWNIVQYNITYYYNGGSEISSNPKKYTVNTDVELEKTSKLGYTFAGWYNGDKLFNSIKPGTTGNLNLTAHWTADKHNLSITSEDTQKGNALIAEGVGYTDEQITIDADSISPFVFKSWCDDDGNIVSLDKKYTFKMPSNDYHLEAKFAEQRTLNLTIDDPTNGTISGSGEKIIGASTTIECVPNDGKTFKGWYDSSDNLVSSFLKYTFEMPEENYYLKAVFMTETEVEQYDWDLAHGVKPKLSDDKTTITYGMYPQKVVDDNDLNIELFEHATYDSASGYYTYNGEYYAKLTAKPFDFVGYGIVDESTVYEENFDNGKEIVYGNVYWYSVKPIEWIICNQQNSTYTLMSKTLIDTKNYNTTEYDRSIDDKIVRPNNYKYSSLRTWANSELYNSIFFLSDSYLLDTLVDNSLASTDANYNPYCCEDTLDKIFFPSVKEIKDYVKKGITAPAKTTDYSRSKNVNYSIESDYLYYCDYWTRSPAAGDAKAANRVHSGGYINGCGVKVGSYCIRPCITIEYI